MNEKLSDLPAQPGRPDAELSRLLSAAAAGDANAFESFYDATVRDALALASQLVPGPLEAILTATYVQAWRDCARFDRAHSALDWLLGIVREMAGSSRRKGSGA